MKTNRPYGGAMYRVLCSAWPYFVFAQVSAVARILFPMATLEPARWAALKGSWSPAALHPFGPEVCTRGRRNARPRGGEGHSVCSKSVWETFSSTTTTFTDKKKKMYGERKKSGYLIKETRCWWCHVCSFFCKRGIVAKRSRPLCFCGSSRYITMLQRQLLANVRAPPFITNYCTAITKE